MHEPLTKESISIAQLDELCANISAQRTACEAVEEELEKQNKILAALEAKAVEYLEALGRTNFPSPHGVIGIRENWRVNLPDSPENWAKLFGYFKEKGMFEGMITVNSNKLNSFYKEEEQIAIEEGRAMEFSIPGLQAPTLFKSMTFRKAKS